MKPQIAIGSKGVAAAYGEVLFRAWKDTPTSEGIAVTMEVCISQLAFCFLL
jgi:hypothetical protein